MKYVVLSLTQAPSERRSMHQFIVEHDGYGTVRLLGSTPRDGTHTALFHIEGWPPDHYEDRPCAVPSVEEYDLSEQSNWTFSVYVREHLILSDVLS